MLAATWGASFLFIKVLDRHLAPVVVAFGRCVLGAATLLTMSWLGGERLRFERRTWMHLVVIALLFNVVPFSLIAFGETKISSVLAGLWNATTPLFVLLFVLLAFPEESLDRSRITGLLIGFAGVAVVLGPWRHSGSGRLIGELACAGAAACYGLAFPYTRRYLAGRSESAVALAAGQLVCATVILAAILPLAGAPSLRLGWDGWGSLLALGALGTGIAYVLNYAIVRAAGSATASTVTYLVPVVSTLLGIVVLTESPHWNEPLGAAILIAGIAVSEKRFRLRRRRT